jgi:hypothetical protein
MWRKIRSIVHIYFFLKKKDIPILMHLQLHIKRQGAEEVVYEPPASASGESLAACAALFICNSCSSLSLSSSSHFLLCSSRMRLLSSSSAFF